MVMPRAESASSIVMFQILNVGERRSARTMTPISRERKTMEDPIIRERDTMENPMSRKRNMIDGVKICLLFVSIVT